MPRNSCHFRGVSACRSKSRANLRSTLARLALTFAILSTASLGTFAANAASIEGIWYDDTGKGAIELRRCGSSLCGHIVWLRDPNKPNGQPLTDELNPTARRRNQPICGLQVIGRLQPQGDGTWDAGWIYDPKQGKAFDVMLQLQSPSRLLVTGYLGVKFLSESFVWRRAPEDLPRCASS